MLHNVGAVVPEGVREFTTANRMLFDALPSQGTEAYKGMKEEKLKAGFPGAPSVDINVDGWSRYASALHREYPYKRSRVVGSKSQSAETRDVKTTRTCGSLDASAGEKSEGPIEPGGYTLRLDRTQLLFIPSLGPTCDRNSISGTVAQVSIRSNPGDGDASDVFSTEQASVTVSATVTWKRFTRRWFQTTIETLVVGHVSGLYKLPERVAVREVVPGYDLVGRRRPWRYGRGKNFCLGDTMLEPAEDKWVFHFEKRE